MASVRKLEFPVDEVRRFLEPGPVVLLCTQWKDARAIMTLGWHMMLGYDLVGTYIDPGNRSHALARRSRLAVTYNPITDEMFYAREGNGAYLNGRRLPLRQVTADIRRAVGGVDFKRIPKQLADRIAVSPPFYSQRNFGSSTLDWCHLAAGRLDLYLHGGQMLWDYAAGSLILREAGGQMCTLLHDDYDADAVWQRPVIAALHPTVFAAWRDWVRQNTPPGKG